MTVRIRNIGKKGRVIDIEGDKAIIEAGVMKINADKSDLVPVEVPDLHQEKLVKKYQVKKNQNTTNSLDLRGMRYDDAQFKLDKYQDDASHEGYKTEEVIHGKRTGA
jgi:DNA mismatch repair protein MutS2